MSQAELVRPLARPRALSTRLFRSELMLIFGRRRNQAGLGVLAIVPIIIAIAVKVAAPRPGEGPDFFSAITGNGLFVALAALTVQVPLFLPLAVSAIAGDSIAGEANLGTLRYLLTVPVGRNRLLAVKFAAIAVFALVATLLVAVVGSIIGVALFGTGPMTTLSGSSLSFVTAAVRVVAAAVYLAIGLMGLGAIGLFVSTLTEQPIGATIAVVVLNLTMFLLDSIPQLSWLQPWLLTHWWTSFGDLFREPIAWDNIWRGVAVSAGYALVFTLAAWARFGAKDVTS